MLLPLWAVHISDGVLTPLWQAGGFVLAGVLVVIAAWRVREDDIARIGLMTAAFFVVSALNIRLGPTSVHLLLNAFVGIILGWKAALAIPIGLFLQAALLQHGGFLSLGVNSCVMATPALLAWALFAGLRRMPWVRTGWFRATLVMTSTMVWSLSLIYCLTLLCTNSAAGLRSPDLANANALTFHPLTLLVALGLAAVAAIFERQLANAPEFPLGFLVGELTVLATVFLHCAALVWGGPDENLFGLALTAFAIHLPIAMIEGVVLGFTVGFLVRVKPEMLGWETAGSDPRQPRAATASAESSASTALVQPERAKCAADPLT
jgi:cobalt/nickel transport system permease protein